MIGIMLVLMGVAMPLLLNVHKLGVYDTLFQALRGGEKVLVVYAALKLVLLNSLRCIPHYLGAFFIGESLEPGLGKRWRQFMRLLAICAIIPLVYFLIERIYGIHYDFGVPAFMLVALLLMLERTDFSSIDIGKKTIMVVLLITSMQFLDVMPMLARLPFGRGEASIDIKLASQLLDADEALQFIATLLFALLFLGSVLMLKLITDEKRLRQLSGKNQRMEREMAERRIDALERRTLMEMRNLVHDLKSPLTAANALISVVRLSLPGESRDQEYLSQAESSLLHMSAMISEILYEDHKSPVTTEHIAGVLLAQLSVEDNVVKLRLDNRAPGVRVEVNEIRFVRALANLVENAKNALRGDDGHITLAISQIVARGEGDGQPRVRFEVRDNGLGIDRRMMNRIWDTGYSGTASSGLGLSFVQQVVRQNNGQIGIESQEGVGTTVRITLPESGDCDE